MGCVTRIYKNDFNQHKFTTNHNFLIHVAGESNIPIFFTSINTLPTLLDSPEVLYTISKLWFYKLFEGLLPGDMREFIIDHKQDEIVFDKHSAAFS